MESILIVGLIATIALAVVFAVYFRMTDKMIKELERENRRLKHENKNLKFAKSIKIEGDNTPSFERW